MKFMLIIFKDEIKNKKEMFPRKLCRSFIVQETIVLQGKNVYFIRGTVIFSVFFFFL